MILRKPHQKRSWFLEVHLCFSPLATLPDRRVPLGLVPSSSSLLNPPRPSSFFCLPFLLVSPPILSRPPSAIAFLALCRILPPCPLSSLSLTSPLSLVALPVSSLSAPSRDSSAGTWFTCPQAPSSLESSQTKTPPPTLPLPCSPLIEMLMRLLSPIPGRQAGGLPGQALHLSGERVERTPLPDSTGKKPVTAQPHLGAGSRRQLRPPAALPSLRQRRR